MTMIEILLLIAGAVIFALGFFIPENNSGKKSTDQDQKAYSDKIKEITETELKDAERKVRDIVNEEVSAAHDSSVRSMEKLTNEKIMAINEYGKTVTDEIERNHKEVVFMYDMLNDKTTDIKNTIRKYEAIEKKAAGSAKPAASNTTASDKKQVKKNEGDAAIHIPKMFASADMPAATEVTGGSPAKAVSGNPAINAMTDADAATKNNEILRLHNENMADIDIAKKLGIGVGEVKLAISLGGPGGADES